MLLNKVLLPAMLILSKVGSACQTTTPPPLVTNPRPGENEESGECLKESEECSQNGRSTCCDDLECRKTIRVCTKKGCLDGTNNCNHCSGGNEVCMRKWDEMTDEQILADMCMGENDTCNPNSGYPCCDGLRCGPLRCKAKWCVFHVCQPDWLG